ncbi:MAG: GPI mannosyltransferase 2 [Linnemannia gamsii]|nr:MAG: GPI mannosyltransferase 2 [Linnemannia gamsii]
MEASSKHPTTPSSVNRISTVAYYALISRLVIWVIAVVSHVLIQDYDSALELTLPIDTTGQQLFKSIFGVFLRWDAFYFVHIAEKGYVFEQAHAFFPLVPALTRLVANTVLAPLSFIMDYKQQLVLAGVIVANASFVAATVQLYILSKELFGREKFAFLSAMLYVLTPSGIFMSAIYTESTFSLLSFTGMLFAARKQYLLAAIAWSISCTARSNGILYAGFIIYDLVVRMDFSEPISRKIFVLAKAGLLCAITWIGFFAVQFYGYSLYCTEPSNIDARPWCSANIPLIYTFVQDFYWNVGFLRYYEVKQIPNFLMAAPMIILSASGIFFYVMFDTHRAFSLGQLINKHTPPFMSLATFPYIVLWAALLLSNITTMHIQIITRAFSCLPPVYWFAAHQFEGGEALGSGWTKTVTTFFVMYGLIGIVLFANFFPPA